MKRAMLVALAAALLMLVLPAAPSGAADAPKIGVVRFTALVNGYKRMQAEQDASIKKREQLRQEQTAKQDEVNRLSAQLQQNAPDSEAYKKTDADLRQKRADLEAWTRMKTEELINEETRIIRQIYEDVEAAAAEYGKKHSYSLIIKEDDLDLVKAGIAELKVKVALRKVLYSDPALDITDALVKLLNEKYAAPKK
jgi:Skp family chaperone for outer membrane proteins